MSGEYTLADLLERMYVSQLALEAALLELTLQSEKHVSTDIAENVRGALFATGENAGHIKQDLAKLRNKDPLSSTLQLRFDIQPLKTAFNIA